MNQRLKPLLVLITLLTIIIVGGMDILRKNEELSQEMKLLKTEVSTAKESASKLAELNDTSYLESWNEYIDEENNFSIRYPQEWIKATDENLIAIKSTSIVAPSQMSLIDIWISKGDMDSVLKDIGQEAVMENINGSQFIVVTVREQSKVYYLPLDNGTVIQIISSSGSKDIEELKLLDQIVHSFKLK